MNDPEVIMSNELPNRGLVAHAKPAYLTATRLQRAIHRCWRRFLASGCSPGCRARLRARRVENAASTGASRASLHEAVRYAGKALEAAGITIALAMKVPAPLKSIADQVIRCASSVPANISEGHGRFGRDRLNHWRIAYGSAREVDTHLRLLVGAGVIEARRAEIALNLFDQIRAMLWRLLHRTA